MFVDYKVLAMWTDHKIKKIKFCSSKGPVIAQEVLYLCNKKQDEWELLSEEKGEDYVVITLKAKDLFKPYKRVQEAQLRPLTEADFKQFAEYGCIYTNDSGTKVSISDADLDNGSPKVGDMIARNPVMHKDQWLVAEEYFKKNFTVLPEFREVGHGVQQSTQYSHVFKEGEEYRDNGAVSFFSTHDVRDVNKGPEERDYVSGYHTKTMNVLGEDGTIKVYRIGIIKDYNNYSPRRFQIPVVQVEYPKDWWNSFALEESFKEYDIYLDRKLIKEFKVEEAVLNWRKEPVEGAETEKFKELLDIAVDKLKQLRSKTQHK